jgi:hypothetical protein
MQYSSTIILMVFKIKGQGMGEQREKTERERGTEKNLEGYWR